GIGMIAASVAQDLGYYKVLGFLNDVVPVGNFVGKYKKHKVIGTTQDITQFLMDSNVYFFIGFIGMKNEMEVFEKISNLNIPRDRFATLIHSSAIIPRGYCKIGYGVLIAPLAQLSPD